MKEKSGWAAKHEFKENQTPRAGDLNNNTVVQGFLLFKLSDIPTNAIVHSATLKLTGWDIDGKPFESKGLGKLKFESIPCSIDRLYPGAYGNQSTIPLTETNDIPFTVDVKPTEIQKQISISCERFWIRFSFFKDTNGDHVKDLFFPTRRGEPTLEIVYTLPPEND